MSYDVANTHAKGLHNVGEFGDKFRKAREKKELSLDDVSNVTKIGTRMLRAIEEENFDLLPGGVFNKGFIRAYAKQLGLDPEDAVNDYLACLRQAQVDSHDAWDATERRDPHAPVVAKAKLARPVKPEVTVQGPLQAEELPELQLPRAEHIRPAKKEYLSRPSSGVSWIRIAAAVCILLSVFFLWTRHSRSNRTAGASSGSSASVPSTTTSAAAPVAPSTPPSRSSAPPVPAASTTPAPTTTPSPRTSTDSAQSSSETPPAINRAPAGTSTDPDEIKVEKKDDVTIRSFGSAATTPAEKPAATLKLIVRATENSWISVTSDGQLVTQETLIAPAATSFHAAQELVVRVGNAAGVSFIWNGEEIQPQGIEAEAKTFIFDAQGMRTATPPQPPAQP